MMNRCCKAYHVQSLQGRKSRSVLTAFLRSMNIGLPQPSRRACSSNKRKPDRPRDLQDDQYFEYTRGRFVSNEQYETSQRHVQFGVQELARIAANAVGSAFCVSIEKYPDGMYNKTLLLTMDDGKQAVAKVPNPNAGRPHYTTASEVATMDYMRTNLKTPIPKVFAWSSRAEAENNPVGAEYIIMEKVSGVQLSTLWAEMVIEDRFRIVKNIARLQKSWTDCFFHDYGSLYYVKDLEDKYHNSIWYTSRDGDQTKASVYTVGPSTGR